MTRANPRGRLGRGNRPPILLVVLTVLLALAPGCGRPDATGEVVLYASLDATYSRPLMKRFEEQTGIQVRFVTDSEATKTTGLVQKLLSERNRPRCDVFWNNEIVQTIVLKKSGCLAPFVARAAADIPPAFKDPEGYWVGFAARARVIIYNRNLVKPPLPQGLRDLLDPRWKGKATLARPLNGTTATHAAVLWARWGPDATKKFFRDLGTNEIRRSAGNAQVRREVAEGSLAWGFTDTDDYHVAHLKHKPVGVIFPDRDGEGTLLIPNTVCLIKNGPHRANALKLIEFILSPEVEEALARGRSAQIPVRDGLPGPTGLEGLETMRVMAVDWPRVGDVFQDCNAWLTGFLRGK